MNATSGDLHLAAAASVIRDGFARGAVGAPDLDLIFALAGQPIALRVHGSALADHLRGVFRHLTLADGAPPVLEIELAALAGADAAILEDLAVPPPGVVTVDPNGSLMLELHDRLAIAIDRGASRVTAIAGDSADLPPSHLSHPFAHIFGWLGAAKQIYVTHGAVIGRGGRGLLLAGSGGQGKSTTALACALAGWEFAGDDFVLLERKDDGSHVAHSLYATGRMHPAQAARFPALVAQWDSLLSRQDNKLTLFPRPGAVTLVPRLTIEAIVLPLVGDGPQISRLPPGAALRALISDSVRIHPGLTRERTQFYAEAVARLPCYILRVSPDIAAIPKAMETILDQAIAG